MYSSPHLKKKHANENWNTIMKVNSRFFLTKICWDKVSAFWLTHLGLMSEFTELHLWQEGTGNKLKQHLLSSLNKFGFLDLIFYSCFPFCFKLLNILVLIILINSVILCEGKKNSLDTLISCVTTNAYCHYQHDRYFLMSAHDQGIYNTGLWTILCDRTKIR